MKVTKQQLKEIVKQELKKVLAEQEEEESFRPRPSYTEDIPEWYKGPGGVAEELNTLRALFYEEIDKLKTRIAVLEPEPEPKTAPAIATGGTPKP